MEIVHQTQLTSSSCVPACIAMITGVDQQLIIDEMAKYHDSSGGMRQEFRQWVRMGYLPRLLPYGDLAHGHGSVFLATVPSLNIAAGNHRIVLDWRGDDGWHSLLAFDVQPMDHDTKRSGTLWPFHACGGSVKELKR